MVPTDVVNLALAEQGQRIQITALNDGTPAGNAGGLFYTPKMLMLLRAANWDFARAQASLTVWKQAVVNGTISSDPPPQPWMFSYLYPSDCVRARFVMPTVPPQAGGTPLTTAPNQIYAYPPAPTGIPFVPGTDFDANGDPIRVILTNLSQAQLVYTRDLSPFPDLWDSLFLSGASALLGAYLINALARNAEQYNSAVAMAKNAIDQARATNGDEGGPTSVDHTPDWFRARRTRGVAWAWNAGGPAGPWLGGGYDSVTFPDGLRY